MVVDEDRHGKILCLRSGAAVSWSATMMIHDERQHTDLLRGHVSQCIIKLPELLHLISQCLSTPKMPDNYAAILDVTSPPNEKLAMNEKRLKLCKIGLAICSPNPIGKMCPNGTSLAVPTPS